MAESRLDHVYRKLLLTKFFTKGWGHPDHLKRIFLLRKRLGRRATAQQCFNLDSHPVIITKKQSFNDHTILEGNFSSPFMDHLPDILPKECQTASFQAVLPLRWTGQLKPLVIQFAGTGDHFYWRRRKLMALPMVKERGIGSIILENPFYGVRKPPGQLRSSLRHVSDLFVMGAQLILESQVLLNWAENEGYGPFCCHGISMGGHMASLAASAYPKPIALVPCLTATSGSVTFCQGVMAKAINWKQLTQQYDQNEKYKSELWHLVDSPEFGETDRFTSIFSSQSGGQNYAEAVHFMRGIMDECTHLKNYDVPVDPELIFIVAAENDAYQPRHSVIPLPDIWPKSNIRYIGEGHIKSYLFHQHIFRQAIYDSLDRLTEKYHS